MVVSPRGGFSTLKGTQDTQLWPYRYRGFIIEPTLGASGVPKSLGIDWTWAHEDFDGGPWEAGGPPMDNRSGQAPTPEACREAIDEFLAEENEGD